MNNPFLGPTLGYNLVCINLGRLAQMVERLPYTQNVGGSIPSAPTSFPNQSQSFTKFSLDLLATPTKGARQSKLSASIPSFGN